MPRKPIAAIDVPSADFSSVGDMAGSMGRISGLFSKVAETLQIRNQKMALRRAKEEGSAAGLSGVQELRRGVKQTDDAFNDALVSTTANRLEVKMRARLRAAEEKFPDNPDEYKKESSAIINGIKDEILTISPEYAGLALTLEGTGLELQALGTAHIQKVFIGQKREKASASVSDLESSILQNIESRIPMGIFDSDSDIATLTINGIASDWERLEAAWQTPDPGGNGPLIPADVIAERRVKLLDSIYENAIRGLILNSDTPGQIAEDILNDTFKIPVIFANQEGQIEITPSEELPFPVVESLVAFGRQQQSRLDARASEAKSEMRAFVGFKLDAMKAELEANGTTTMELTPEEALLYTGDPMSAAMLTNSMSHAKELAVASAEVNRESVRETQLRLMRMPRVEGMDAPDDLKAFRTIADAMDKKLEALKKDPVAFTIGNSDNAADAGRQYSEGTITEEQFRQVLLDEQKRLSEGMMGFRPKILSEDEALDIVTDYSSLENEQQMVEFATAQQERFGGFLGDAMEQAVEKGLPSSVAMMAGLDSRSRESRLLARAIALGPAEMSKRLPEDVKMDDIRLEVNSQLTEFIAALPPGNDQVVSSVREAAMLLTAAGVSFDGKGVNKSAKSAMDALVFSQYKIYNGVLLPVQVSEDERILRSLSASSIDKILDDYADRIDPLFSSGDPTMNSIDYARFLKEGARFVPSEDNTGLELVDHPSTGRPVFLESGIKLKIGWDELRRRGEQNIVKESPILRMISPDSREEAETSIRTGREVKQKAKDREAELMADPGYDSANFDEVQRLVRDGVDVHTLTGQDVRKFKMERTLLYGTLLDFGMDPGDIQKMSLEQLREAAKKNAIGKGIPFTPPTIRTP